MKELLRELGLNISYIVAGFLGGVVRAFVAQDPRPWIVVGFIVIGAVTANYITELLAKYLSFNPGAAGFFVGFTATVLLQRFLNYAEKIDPFPKSGDKE